MAALTFLPVLLQKGRGDDERDGEFRLPASEHESKGDMVFSLI